jgi:hypothetical protein
MQQVMLVNIDTYSIKKYAVEPDERIRLESNELKSVVRIAKDAFGSSMPDNEVKRVIMPNTFLWIAYKEGIGVGFTAATQKQNEIYLAAAAIVKSERGKGLYPIFNKLRIEEGLNKNFSIFTTRTQNPNVERGITNTLEVLKSNHQIKGYVIKHDLVPGVYGRLLTEEIQKSPDSSINQTFSILNHKRGDAFYITFSVTR